MSAAADTVIHKQAYVIETGEEEVDTAAKKKAQTLRRCWRVCGYRQRCQGVQ